jgi:hypothetical protein
VGQSSVGALELPAFATEWSHGRVIDLGGLPGFTVSEALSINDAGRVVGFSEFGSGTIPESSTWERWELPVSRACARDLGVASEGVPCALPNHPRHRRRTVARACGGYVAGGFELGRNIAQRARAPGKGIARKFLGQCDCLRRRLGYAMRAARLAASSCDSSISRSAWRSGGSNHSNRPGVIFPVRNFCWKAGKWRPPTGIALPPLSTM